MGEGIDIKAFSVGARVSKQGGDYSFQGEIRTLFRKRSGKWRVVVENDDGILHIFNPGQLVPAPPQEGSAE